MLDKDRNLLHLSVRGKCKKITLLHKVHFLYVVPGLVALLGYFVMFSMNYILFVSVIVTLWYKQVRELIELSACKGQVTAQWLWCCQAAAAFLFLD